MVSENLIPISIFNSYALLLYNTFLSLSLFLEVQLTSNSINSPLFITENSETNSKTIQKIKKPLSGIIPSQNEMRLVEKGRKKF